MTRTHPRTHLGVGVGALLSLSLALAGCASSQPAPSPMPSPSTAAEQYCTDKGGTVQSRQPTFGTNNAQSTWVDIGQPIQVCRFQTIDDDANSRIYVDLVTLSSPKPTLAAIAYLAKTTLPDANGGNPADALCAALGGATAYGASANGGGLVNTTDPDDIVFEACTFADQSFIDVWGIAYYSESTARGIDLAEVFGFKPDAVVPVFG